MKKYFTLLLLLTATFAFAQKVKIKVEEQNENIGGGKHNALVVIIYDSNKDDIEKEWKSLMKDYNAKVSGKDEIFADNAMIKAMSENTVDVYARVEKVNDKECKLIVGFLMGETWLSSSGNKAAYNAAEKIVKDFANKTTKDGMAGITKAENKKLKELKDDKSDLEKKNDNLKKDIEDYKAKLAKAEEDLKKNEEDQKKKQQEIDDQQKKVDAAKAREGSVE